MPCYSPGMRKTHGLSGTRIYVLHRGMIDRCENPKATYYKDYGGRGIKVCKRWRESVEAFVADMGPRPSPKHTIDRIDNDGDYEPGNCRWATMRQQHRNTRKTIMVEWKGITKPLKDWEEELGFSDKTLYHRLHTFGWSVERAFTTPALNLKEVSALATKKRKAKAAAKKQQPS